MSSGCLTKCTSSLLNHVDLILQPYLGLVISPFDFSQLHVCNKSELINKSSELLQMFEQVL